MDRDSLITLIIILIGVSMFIGLMYLMNLDQEKLQEELKDICSFNNGEFYYSERNQFSCLIDDVSHEIH